MDFRFYTNKKEKKRGKKRKIGKSSLCNCKASGVAVITNEQTGLYKYSSISKKIGNRFFFWISLGHTWTGLHMFADDMCVNTHTQNSMCIVRVMNLERTEFLESVRAKSNSGNLHTLQW